MLSTPPGNRRTIFGSALHPWNVHLWQSRGFLFARYTSLMEVCELYNIPIGSKIETQIPAVSVLSAQEPLYESGSCFPGDVNDKNKNLCRRIQPLLRSAEGNPVQMAGPGSPQCPTTPPGMRNREGTLFHCARIRHIRPWRIRATTGLSDDHIRAGRSCWKKHREITEIFIHQA